MSGFYSIWKEGKGHLRCNIPDTVIIEQGSVKDWFYTSKVNYIQKGYIMKHLSESTILQAIRDKILNEDIQGDPIVCILRSRPSEYAGKENNGNTKLMLKSHFETYFMNLLNCSVRAEETNSSLQKFVRPCNDVKYVVRVKTKSSFECEINGESFSGSYYINGKYSSDTHLKVNTDTTVSCYDKQALEDLAKGICEYIKKYNTGLEGINMEWIKDSTGVFFLININVICRKSSIKNTSRSISPKFNEQSFDKEAAKLRIHRIKPKRPLSLPRATSASKAVEPRQPQPPPTQKHSTSFRSKHFRSDSSSRIDITTPRSEVFPTPRGFTSTSRSIIPGSDTHRSMPPIINISFNHSERKHSLKLYEDQDINNEKQLISHQSIEECNETSSAEVSNLRKRNEDLEKKLYNLKAVQRKQLEELDLKWRAKCLMLYNSLNAKHQEEMQTLWFQILELTEKLNIK